MIRVFLDANIYFAGMVSKIGASSFILELARRKKIEVFSSKLVLRETERNLRKKAPEIALKDFHRLLQTIKISVLPAPDESLSSPYEEILHSKDLPILAASIASKSDFLITLDRRYFLTLPLLAKLKKPNVLTPGDFLRDIFLKEKI